MSKVITVPVTTFTSLESVIHRINEVVADKNIQGIFYTKSSLIKGEIEILVDENTQKVVKVERPSKFKANAQSQYYCVYQRHGKWTYKFVRQGKSHDGKIFETEIEAALAYDDHVFSVDGNVLKTNFPENFNKVAE